MSRAPPDQRGPLLLELLSLSPSSSQQGVSLRATAAQVAMVSWLPTGSPWLGTQEACPLWPCLNLPMAAWQGRRLALASPSDALAVGSPVSGWISLCPRQAQRYRCGCHLPGGCRHGLSSSPRAGASVPASSPEAGAQKPYSLGTWGSRLPAPQPGLAVPGCGATIKGKAEGLRVCVSACPDGLSPVCPWPVSLSLASLFREPPTSPVHLGSVHARLPGWRPRILLLVPERVCAFTPVTSLCVSLHGLFPLAFSPCSEPRAMGSRVLCLSHLAPSPLS